MGKRFTQYSLDNLYQHMGSHEVRKLMYNKNTLGKKRRAKLIKTMQLGYSEDKRQDVYPYEQTRTIHKHK